MIPSFSDCGIRLIDPLPARTVLVMIVDDPAGLKVGVDRNRAAAVRSPVTRCIVQMLTAETVWTHA